jgi:hypothetical protein
MNKLSERTLSKISVWSILGTGIASFVLLQILANFIVSSHSTVWWTLIHLLTFAVSGLSARYIGPSVAQLLITYQEYGLYRASLGQEMRCYLVKLDAANADMISEIIARMKQIGLLAIQTSRGVEIWVADNDTEMAVVARRLGSTILYRRDRPESFEMARLLAPLMLPGHRNQEAANCPIGVWTYPVPPSTAYVVLRPTPEAAAKLAADLAERGVPAFKYHSLVVLQITDVEVGKVVQEVCAAQEVQEAEAAGDKAGSEPQEQSDSAVCSVAATYPVHVSLAPSQRLVDTVRNDNPTAMSRACGGQHFVFGNGVRCVVWETGGVKYSLSERPFGVAAGADVTRSSIEKVQPQGGEDVWASCASIGSETGGHTIRVANCAEAGEPVQTVPLLLHSEHAYGCPIITGSCAPVDKKTSS